MDDRTIDARRRFLRGAGAAGAVGAAVAAGVTAGQRAVPAATPQADAADAAQPAGKGYRESEHVRRYYRTTTI